jgi:hypothetical protein
MLKDSALYVLWHRCFKSFWSSMQELTIKKSDPKFAKTEELKSQLNIFLNACHPSHDTANNCPTRENLQLLVDCLNVLVYQHGMDFCRQNTDWNFVISEFHVFVLERERDTTFNIPPPEMSGDPPTSAKLTTHDLLQKLHTQCIT